MEATGGMSKTLRRFLREWTREDPTLGTSTATRDLVKEISYTLVKGQTEMLDNWLAQVYAIQIGQAHQGSHCGGGTRSPWRPNRPRRQPHQRRTVRFSL